MATIVLGAVGGAIGGAIGGSVLGVSGAVIGRAVGSTVGQIIDQRYFSQGSPSISHGRIDRFRVSGASEGAPIADIVGRLRVPGQIIWASRFLETKTVSGGGGGKGGPTAPSTTTYSYSVSLAIALCEGEIQGIGRMWADGQEINTSGFEMRVYTGTADQLPDPLIETIEGEQNTPAYRGIAYVVFENLPLESFGNRVPQLSFEVLRHATPEKAGVARSPMQNLPGVALIPGTGEYSLATEAVYLESEPGVSTAANVNSITEEADLVVSVRSLKQEIPSAKAATLVSCWFGDDLRCGDCSLTPRVEQTQTDGDRLAWSVSGVSRSDARLVSRIDNRPAFGGTPCDAAVLEGIKHLQEQGIDVIIYPFILMDVPLGNGLPDPWDPSQDEQPVFPWRGRITTSLARGVAGSVQGSAAAIAEVAAFFGTVKAADFTIADGEVTYTGPEEFSYSRFILHHAALGAAAGGVAGFTIGSEMRALTQIMGPNRTFPAVEQLRALAAEVRALLPEAKIGYAADWSEYFGYQPQDGSGDVYFHLDPLWADENIDFIGIDNYMPLGDWRDGTDHLDAQTWSQPDRRYFEANVTGGEGYDWFYPSSDARDAQRRVPITPDPYGEDWIYRYKDIAGWWSHFHYDRIGGVQQTQETPWLPKSKPIWFTEIGCPAINKGANQPNVFYDGISSESAVPYYSNGQRDDVEQIEYYAAHLSHWEKDENNPQSDLYEGRMIDTSKIFGWAWDGRPWPAFPNLTETWADCANYGRGHWLNGRAIAQPLAAVLAEVCEAAGLMAYNVDQVRGIVRGASFSEVQSARADLQPLMMTFGVEAIEAGAEITFRMARTAKRHTLTEDDLAVSGEKSGRIERVRLSGKDQADRLRLQFVEAEGAYLARTADSLWPGTTGRNVDTIEVPLALTTVEAVEVVERLHAVGQVAAETLSFALPLSRRDVQVGDLVLLRDNRGGETKCKITRIEEHSLRLIEAVRFDPTVYQPSGEIEETTQDQRFVRSVPVVAEIMDLPLLSSGDDVYSPYVAVAARPWPVEVAIYGSKSQTDYALEGLVRSPSIIGTTQTTMRRARPGLWDRGHPLEVKLIQGVLSSKAAGQVFNGANAAAIRHPDGGAWEVFQFQTADLVAPNTYHLSNRLRGQRGTEFAIPDEWPVGCRVVLLDAGTEQLLRTADDLGLPHHYLFGPSHLAPTHPVYRTAEHTPLATGARPFAPVHLRATVDADGTLSVSWLRRTRLGGDQWRDDLDVPLSEQAELYRWSVRDQNGGVAVQGEVSEPRVKIPLEGIGAVGAVTIEVAQSSEIYGVGPAAVLALSLG